MSEDNSGADGSFEARLRAARSRQAMDAPPASSRGDQSGALGVGLRVGVELVSALAVAVGIGWVLDHWLHTLPLFLIVFVLLGGAAGLLNVWRQVGPSGKSGPVQD